MPELRKSVRKRRVWISIAAAVALAAAAVFDWSRPSYQQWSVRLFDRGVIGSYRTYIRPITKRFIVCRFNPTCSAYGQMAIYVHGFPKGMWLTTKRLVRCGPWTPRGTNDLVPPPRVPQPPHDAPNEK
jgi:hypothetical protein